VGFAFSDADNVGAYGSTAVSTSTGVDIAVGDLVVVAAWGNLEPTAFVDSESNSYTLATSAAQSNNNVRIAWCVATNGGSGVTHTVTYEAGTGTRTVNVLVFTPDSGDTVSVDFEVSEVLGWTDSPFETPSDDTTEADAVGVAIIGSNGTETWTNQKIGGSAATVQTMTYDYATVFYRILTAQADGVTAYTELGAGTESAEMLVFKSVAAGGATHQLSGSADSISLLSGAIDQDIKLIGSSDSVSLLSGAINRAMQLSGSADSASLLTGAINRTLKLSGSVDSVSLLSGNVRIIPGGGTTHRQSDAKVEGFGR